MFDDHRLRKRIHAGIPVLGTWNTMAAPLATEAMALGGFDFQVIDLEHGPFVLDRIHEHVSACKSSTSCAPLVRVPTNADWMVLQALDQGAHGVVVPHVPDVDAARGLAASLRYRPEGERGFTPFSKAGGFTNRDVAGHVERSNAGVVGVAIVESLAGLEVAGEIAAVEGIDVVYFGAYDLSQDLGHPGQPMHPEVVEAISDGVGRVRAAGGCAGGFVPQDREGIAWLLEMGMGFITYEVDASILHHHVADVSDWFAGELGR